MKSEIILYLLHNQEYLKNLINKFLIYKNKLLEKEPKEFKLDILNQYKTIVRFMIANEITQRLAVDYETVIVTLEELNIEEYLSL